MAYKTDIEIARAATKLPIQEIGAKLGITSDDLCPMAMTKPKCLNPSSIPCRIVKTVN